MQRVLLVLKKAQAQQAVQGLNITLDTKLDVKDLSKSVNNYCKKGIVCRPVDKYIPLFEGRI